MKRSLKPQVRTHLKVKAALLNLPLSHFVWWAEQSVVRATQPHRSGPRAPRKRSRSSWNVTNWSFKFYIFPEKKKKKKKKQPGVYVGGTLRTFPVAEEFLEWPPFDLASHRRHGSVEAGEPRIPAGQPEEPHLTSGPLVKPSVLYFPSV